MPKFEVTVLTKFECEAENETRATIACCAMTASSATIKSVNLDPSDGRARFHVLRETIKPCSSDVTRIVPLVNDKLAADTLMDVDREADDCCEICEFPASAGHDTSCPKCPTLDEKGNMKTGFLSQPNRERVYEDSSLQEMTRAEDVSVRDIEPLLRAIDETHSVNLPRALRRVLCHLGTTAPDGFSLDKAAAEVNQNFAAFSLAISDYAYDIVLGLHPDLRLYVDFKKQEVKQMSRPHLLGPHQEWF